VDISYNSFSPERVEWAYGMAIKKQEENDWNWVLPGFRAAKDRAPKMMMALERCAEVMHQMQEAQALSTRRSAETFAEQQEFTEYQMFREAFKMADEGHHQTMKHFVWIYGAVGLLCGYTN
jgi:hypothetical protein